jgi:hypothetical protein
MVLPISEFTCRRASSAGHIFQLPAARFVDHLHHEANRKVFWDDKDGFYYDRNEKSGKQIHVKSVGQKCGQQAEQNGDPHAPFNFRRLVQLFAHGGLEPSPLHYLARMALLYL